jgi:Cut8, nuclear proteasome tether protein
MELIPRQATLPTQSLLPLLNSLIQSQPTLKPVILSLIPRPSLDTALQALSQSAKRLRDAYPYSNHPPSQISLTSALGFGFGSNPISRPTSHSHSSSSLGFGSHVPLHTLGVSSNTSSDTPGGMREEYIVSRLRPPINDFVASFQSYLPYFSQRAFNSTPHSSGTPQPPRRDRCPPTETFLFLQSLTSHILAQPSLTQVTLVPLILSRLLDEWKVWVEHVDEVVNRQAGMFGGETVRGWERVLDEFADVKGNGLEALREIRDSWIAKVGWLVGRVGQTMMED